MWTGLDLSHPRYVCQHPTQIQGAESKKHNLASYSISRPILKGCVGGGITTLGLIMWIGHRKEGGKKGGLLKEHVRLYQNSCAIQIRNLENDAVKETQNNMVKLQTHKDQNVHVAVTKHYYNWQWLQTIWLTLLIVLYIRFQFSCYTCFSRRADGRSAF